MSRLKVFLLLALVALLSATFMNAVNGYTQKMSLEKELLPDPGSYADRHVERAIHLLDYGTLGDEKEPFLGGFARGPIEAGYIALAFALFGRDMWSLWVLNALVFVAAVWLLYLISTRFLGDVWGVIPAFLCAAFWGISLYVFNVNNEIASLLFVLGFVYALLRYFEGGHLWLLVVAGVLLGLLVLAKPIFEYFLPVAAFLLFWQVGQRAHWRTAAIATAVFSIGFLAVVGGWHARNYAVLGTPKISAGGHSILIRAQSALYPSAIYKGFFVASVAGDAVADAVVPGYAIAHEPRKTIRGIFNDRRPTLRSEGLSEFETDDIFFAEAFRIIREHPLRYAGITPAWLLRMNNIPRHNGGMMERLLVDTRPEFSRLQKVAINIAVRLPWFMFIGIVWWMIMRTLYYAIRKEEHILLVWMAVFALYTNMAYAFLAHAEVRYVLVAMPFYFLFLALFLKDCFVHEN